MRTAPGLGFGLQPPVQVFPALLDGWNGDTAHMVIKGLLGDGRDCHPGDCNKFVKEDCPTSMSPLIFLSEQEIASIGIDSLCIKHSSLLCIY